MTAASVSLGGAEDLLTLTLPNYDLERTILSLALGVAIVFWIIVVPSLVASRKTSSTSRGTITSSKKVEPNEPTTIKKKAETITTVRVNKGKPGKSKGKKAATSSNGGLSVLSKEFEPATSRSSQEPRIIVAEQQAWLPMVTVLASLATCFILIVTQSSTNAFAARGIFEAPLLRANECQSILDRAYQAANQNIANLEQGIKDNTVVGGHDQVKNSTNSSLLLNEPLGWQKMRHRAYPTIDLNLVTDPFTTEDRSYIQGLLDTRLAPLVQRLYGLSSANSIRANDMFVVRYTPETRAFLAKHTDDSDISFNILLSDDFEGGGTRFWSRLTQSEFTTVRPKRIGQVLLHSSLVKHEGLPVTAGTRHILVGFLAVDRMEALTAEPTGLSWFATYFSFPFLHVKLKEGYNAAHIRNQKRAIGDSDKKRWTDDKYVRSLFRDLILLVESIGDAVCPHQHYSLVESSNTDNTNTAAADAFIMQLDQAAVVAAANRDTIKQKKASWFLGQQLALDFDGTVASEWKTRRQSQEDFRDL